jgi:hypothetical protein
VGYFAVCTFDLKDASYEDYKAAYADLTSIGFSKKVVSTQGGTIMLPTTTTAGEFPGTSAGAVRDVLRERVQKAFAARRFISEIFISVGGDWCWGYVRT